MVSVTEWKNADADTRQLTDKEAKEMFGYLYRGMFSRSYDHPDIVCKCGRPVGTNVIFGPFCLGEVCAEEKFTDDNIVCSAHKTMQSLDRIVQKEKMTENEARMNDFINQGIKEYFPSINPCVTAIPSTSSSTA